ncbi:MAG: hypothetical protein A2Y38_11040 [Spirochaetes bacterium GWB1_59_5]|nr:MAG: hypothetical protein A2Y38_11040 [Spirochaetes bacterium GWB1_59_5]
MSARGWYGRPVAATCAVLAAVAGAVYLLFGAEFGPREALARSAFAVTIRHYGVDAREMERSVALPLEDALSAAPGAIETSSSSEYGKARVIVRFAFGANKESAYEAVRDAAERVYGLLPSSVQKPEIGTTSEGRGPVWAAAVYSELLTTADTGRILERSVKPALEKLTGAGEVELAGTGLPEVLVEVDEAAAATMGVDAGTVARFLAMNDVLAPAGTVRSEGRMLVLVADGRFAEVAALQDALVASASGRPVPLGAFCSIVEGTRKPETLSRVNGKPAMTIAVNPGGGANLPALSRALARETESLATTHGIRFEVLSDVGAEVARSFGSTLSATFQGALAVAFASAALVGADGSRRRKKARLVAVAAVPVILAISAAVLTSLDFGLDRHVLAGLAVGLGASVDSVILAAERLGKADAMARGRNAMRELAPSLASGTATTLIVLVPLAGLDFLSEGVARVAAAIGSISIVSYLYTVLFLPPLMLNCRESVDAEARASIRRPRRFARRLHRLLALNALLCAKKPALPLAVAASLSIAGLVAVFVMPLDPRELEEDNAVYAQLEFEPGSAVDIVDMYLANYSSALSDLEGVTSIQSTARRGSGSVFVSFNPSKTDRDRVSAAVRKVPVPGGFAWIPGSSSGERSWELVVSGADDAECQRLATLAAQAVSSLTWISETVLNFKDGPLDLILSPNRNRVASLGLGFSNAAAVLRRSVHGPVAYKRIGLDGETDVRVTVSRAGPPEASDTVSTLVLSARGTVRVDSFMDAGRMRDAARINRRDRQRVASITMRSSPIDPARLIPARLGAPCSKRSRT